MGKRESTDGELKAAERISRRERLASDEGMIEDIK